jgi:hypothetical protein
MHTWHGPWPLEIRKKLDELACTEGHVPPRNTELLDDIILQYDTICSEFDLTLCPRRARLNQEGP